MNRESDNNDREFMGRRRKANVRLALALALLVVAIYVSFILSYL